MFSLICEYKNELFLINSLIFKNSNISMFSHSQSCQEDSTLSNSQQTLVFNQRKPVKTSKTWFAPNQEKEIPNNLNPYMNVLNEVNVIYEKRNSNKRKSWFGSSTEEEKKKDLTSTIK